MDKKVEVRLIKEKKVFFEKSENDDLFVDPFGAIK
jgi:hypothetical protein